MNKTLESYRKLAEAYKELGFEDYAVAELWTALEETVLANAILLDTLTWASMALRTFGEGDTAIMSVAYQLDATIAKAQPITIQEDRR